MGTGVSPFTLWQCWPDLLDQHSTKTGCPGRDPSSKGTYLGRKSYRMNLVKLDRSLSRAWGRKKYQNTVIFSLVGNTHPVAVLAKLTR